MAITSDIIKQMLVSILRKLLFTAGMYLVTKGYLAPGMVDHITNDSTLWVLAGFVFLVGSVIWQYAKIKFNNLAIKQGIKAEAGTPVEVVKTDALEKGKFVTSL